MMDAGVILKAKNISVLAILVMSAIVGSCGGSVDANRPGALQQVESEVDVRLMEIPYATTEEMIQSSTAIVIGRLTSVEAGPEVPAQAEDRSETVREMVLLRFGLISTLRGDPPSDLAVLWPGFDRSTEGTAKVLINGADLQSLGSNQDVLLFLRIEQGNWVINSTDGVWRALPNGKLQSPFHPSESAVRAQIEQLSVDDVLGLVGGELYSGGPAPTIATCVRTIPDSTRRMSPRGLRNPGRRTGFRLVL